MKKQNDQKQNEEDSVPAQNLDLFLNEDYLIALAMRDLRGRRPPNNKPDQLSDENGSYSSVVAQKTLLGRELESRGWTSRDLAVAANLAPVEANALVKGNAKITAELAVKFAKLFATSEEFWLVNKRNV